MKDTRLVSVIIPVYNTVKFLPSCIESVLNQSITDFELLLIDDGSTDGSGAICDEYAKKDCRVRVFHKENDGVSSARNLGLDNAHGEWLEFVDSDDLLPENAITNLLSHVDDDVDMVYGGIRKFDENDDDLETIAVKSIEKVSILEVLHAYVAPREWNGDWQRYLPNRVYRMSLVRKFGLRFQTNVYYKEDGVFLVQYLCRCQNKVVCIPEIVYLYRQNDTSAMGSLATIYNERLLTNVDAHGLIYKEIKNRDVGKELLERELMHLIQNYDWIRTIMNRSGADTLRNKNQLLRRIIKNAGFANFFYYFVLLRYGRKIKEKLL